MNDFPSAPPAASSVDIGFMDQPFDMSLRHPQDVGSLLDGDQASTHAQSFPGSLQQSREDAAARPDLGAVSHHNDQQSSSLSGYRGDRPQRTVFFLRRQ